MTEPTLALIYVALLIAIVATVIGIVRNFRRIASQRRRERQSKPEPASEPAPPVAQELRPAGSELSEKAGNVEPIFVCYRRGDSADVTGRIRDHLVSRFGQGAVFTDVDSIPLGVDFRKHLDQVVGKCRVLLAIVGPRWAERSESSKSALDAGDFVRIEIESALTRDIPVIPVLVGGASMPAETDLPESMAPFSYRNATLMRPDPDFRADIRRLIESLEDHLRSAGKA